MFIFEITIMLVCIGLNAVLAYSEVAFIASDRSVLRGLAEAKSKTAKRLLELKRRPEQILSVIQIGITFVGMFAAAIGGAGAQMSLAPWLTESLGVNAKVAEVLSTLVIVLPLTYFSVVFGELVPKTIALRKPIKSALKLVNLVSVLRRLLLPIAVVLEWSTQIVVRRICGAPADDSKAEDTVSRQGKEYIANLFKTEQAQVSDALIEWRLVTSISVEDSAETVERILITSGHTRLPVLEKGRVIGLLNYKEFFALRKAGTEHWMSLVRAPIVFEENLPLLAAFKALQRQSAHLGIVGSETEPLGIITIEDILEEIVGDIYDEDDFGSIEEILKHTRYYR